MGLPFQVRKLKDAAKEGSTVEATEDFSQQVGLDYVRNPLILLYEVTLCSVFEI